VFFSIVTEEKVISLRVCKKTKGVSFGFQRVKEGDT
jgi:hypothetical protein